MTMILDLKETETSTMNNILENLREEIIYIREENIEITRISELQTEKDNLHLLLFKEKEKEKDLDISNGIEKILKNMTPISIQNIPQNYLQNNPGTYDAVLTDPGSNSKLELKSFLKVKKALSEILLWLESKRVFVNKIVPPLKSYLSPDRLDPPDEMILNHSDIYGNHNNIYGNNNNIYGNNNNSNNYGSGNNSNRRNYTP